jgi:derlin-1
MMGASPMDDLLGIVVGHLFYFLDVKYPETSGKRWLKTPDFLNNMFPPSQMNIQGFTTAQAQPQRQQNLFGGQGRRLVD